MTYVVTDACIKCKYMDCVEVCEPECPAEAILPDTEKDVETWLELNATFSAQWPNVTRKADQTPADADEHKGEADKYDKYFSAEPGAGD
jgi:ferredoxin